MSKNFNCLHILKGTGKKKFLILLVCIIMLTCGLRIGISASDTNTLAASVPVTAGSDNINQKIHESIKSTDTALEASIRRVDRQVEASKLKKSADSEVKASKLKKSDTVTVTISAAGDCTLGVDSRYNNNFNNYYNQNGADYFLKNVKSVFKKDDITIVNFEGTLTNSSNRADKTFTFKGDASYTNILKKGSVEVVNLANNHSFDFGQQGFDDTVKNLTKAGLPYSYNQTIVYKKVNGVKTAFLGFSLLNGASKQQVKEGIAAAKAKKAKIIIVSFHWGIERDYYPNITQQDMGRYAIEQGADLVLGHHPHVLQGIEKYKGCYIVYSLGNFCFGGNSNPSDKDTMIFQQTFYVKNGKLLQKNDAEVIPCSLSSVSYTNNFQPKVLTGNEKKQLINKINQFSSGMGVTVKSNGKLAK